MRRTPVPGWWVVAGLALLSAPRVVLHDLDVVNEQTFVNLVLAITPPLVAIALVATRGWAPIATGFRLGIGYAAVLVVGHQVLWTQATEDDRPRLGDRLADVPDGAQELIFRTAAGFSSLVTGVVVGLLVGLLAGVIQSRRRGSPGRSDAVSDGSTVRSSGTTPPQQQ